MRKLWKFSWDCGRGGNVESVFVADGDEVRNAIGKEVYFGEILGKHSEVYGTLEATDVKELLATEEQIQWLIDTFEAAPDLYSDGSKTTITIMGHNPLQHIRSDDEEKATT